MHIQATHHGGVSTIHIFGELDSHTASMIREEIDGVLNLSKYQDIVYDFDGLSFMDSTGIGMMIGRYKKIRQFNIPSYISGANLCVEKVIELAGLYKIMPKF